MSATTAHVVGGDRTDVRKLVMTSRDDPPGAKQVHRLRRRYDHRRLRGPLLNSMVYRATGAIAKYTVQDESGSQ